MSRPRNPVQSMKKSAASSRPSSSLQRAHVTVVGLGSTSGDLRVHAAHAHALREARQIRGIQRRIEMERPREPRERRIRDALEPRRTAPALPRAS